MIDEGRLADLLLTWEERFDQGEDVLAAALCQDCPELAGILAERIAKLKKAAWVTKRIGVFPPLDAIQQVPLLPSGVEHPVIAGQYRLDHFIAEGGFGQVWRGFDLVLERPVAVKVPKPNRLADAERIERFLAEARRVARLRHPNIVPVFNVVRHKGAYFIILDLIEGKDLRQRMKVGRLPVREIVRIVLDVADAVDHAHRQGVIHRDIKPANILLDENGSVFITDFGIASTVENAPGKEVYGTLPYMSPEQLNGSSCDARSDVYSLGGVLHELLTGESPAPSLTQSCQIKPVSPPNEYLVEDFEKPRSLSPVDGNQNASTRPSVVPPVLAEISRKSLALEPGDRFGSAREMADALRSAVSGIVTENDWLTCTDPVRMLAHLCNLCASPRKMRLFACACVGPDFYGLLERSRNAVLVAERYADGQATAEELKAAADGAWEATYDSLADALFAAACTAENDASQAAIKTAKYVSAAIQCQMLHDLFGPTPFRSPSIDPSWLSWKDGSVARLARKLYEAKEFPRTQHIAVVMRKLGDMLEEAGCADQAVLSHCRGGGRHRKGCWVLDLLLGKN